MPKTAAVVSLFNPDDGVLANAAALLGQVDSVVVVDDGSPQDPARILAALGAMGCKVVRLTENSGIAAALNAGITAALAADTKPDYILTMDQDSLLDPGYVDALLAAAAAAGEAGVPVGMVAPASVRGLPVRRGPVLNGIQLGGEPIQSGLLVPVPVLERLGLFQGTLFIDGVDSEFYLRCEAVGLRTVLAAERRTEPCPGQPGRSQRLWPGRVCRGPAAEGQDGRRLALLLSLQEPDPARPPVRAALSAVDAQGPAGRLPPPGHRHAAGPRPRHPPGECLPRCCRRRAWRLGTARPAAGRRPRAYGTAARAGAGQPAFLARRMTGRSMKNQLAAASGIVHSVAATVNHHTPQW